MEHNEQPSTLLLPVSAATRGDLGRLAREAEALDNYIRQWAIRKDGSSFAMPRVSQLLNETISINKLNVLQSADRKALMVFLADVKEQAPLLHMSFSSDPPPIFIAKLTTWLRKEIHPHLLLQIGLQPNIGAGCIVRTTNKYFDFSLRRHMKDQKDKLIQLLHKLNETETHSPQQPAAEEAAA